MAVKKLGFGLMRLPLLNKEDRTSFDKDQIREMTDCFMAGGFTYFDTAYMYHDYKSECIVKEMVTDRYPRDSFTIADKLPTMQLKTKDDQVRIFDEQLDKVGVDYFDYYLLHSLSGDKMEMVEDFDCFGFIRRKKEEGKIRHIGFSFHDDAETLDRILSEHPEVEFVQLQLNYLDWDHLRVQSRRNYETVLRHGRKVVVMEPVKGGSLVNVPQEVRDMYAGAEPGMSVASWAIRFAAGLPGVMMVLSGMSTMEQMLDNTSYMSDFKPLSESDKELVWKARDMIMDSRVIPCTSCRYCVEGCPQGIVIPEYFSLYNEEVRPTGTCAVTGRKAYEELGRTGGKAGECIKCGQCSSICPQHIDIPSMLEKVVSTFEG